MRNDYDYCDGIKQINITQKILLKHQNINTIIGQNMCL